MLAKSVSCEYQLVKQRLSIYSPLSAFHADSITPRGSFVIVRHHLSPLGNIAPEEDDWRQMLAERLPEAEVIGIDVDRRRNLRARLFFPNPIVRCAGGCGSLVEVPTDPDESDLLCYECYLDAYLPAEEGEGGSDDE